MELTTKLSNTKLIDNYIVQNARGGLKLMLSDRATAIYFTFLILILLLGVFGQALAPYQYDKTFYDEEGSIERAAPPSLEHPLGTNDVGQDVLSRLMYGAQPTVLSGLLGGALIIGIGMTVGVTAGYVGGVVDSVLMRLTDVIYGIPILPFAIVLVALFGVNFITSIMIIGLLLWRGNARVLRSQVLQIKERPFVRSAKATGAGHLRILFKHILPNVMSMAVLFFALGIGYTIIIQASLSFLGVTNPYVPSWGIMLRNAYNSGLMSAAWWWSIPPGAMIALTVLSTFMFGRGYEKIANQGESGAFQQAG